MQNAFGAMLDTSADCTVGPDGVIELYVGGERFR